MLCLLGTQVTESMHFETKGTAITPSTSQVGFRPSSLVDRIREDAACSPIQSMRPVPSKHIEESSTPQTTTSMQAGLQSQTIGELGGEASKQGHANGFTYQPPAIDIGGQKFLPFPLYMVPQQQFESQGMSVPPMHAFQSTGTFPPVQRTESMMAPKHAAVSGGSPSPHVDGERRDSLQSNEGQKPVLELGRAS